VGGIREEDVTFIHPPLQQLLDYWQAKRGARSFPSRHDLDPLEMPFAIGNLLLLDVVPGDPLRFRYRLWGSNVAQQLGRDMTGHFVDEWEPKEFAEQLHRDYSGVVQRRQPERRVFDEVIGDRLFTHERLLLPLGEADQVTMILAGIYHARQR
jgi:hypothetical protein